VTWNDIRQIRKELRNYGAEGHQGKESDFVGAFYRINVKHWSPYLICTSVYWKENANADAISFITCCLSKRTCFPACTVCFTEFRSWTGELRLKKEKLKNKVIEHKILFKKILLVFLDGILLIEYLCSRFDYG
jgi:hypothetical protein